MTESTEDGELSEPVKEFLGGKQVFVHTDDLIGFLRDRCSGKETIYFIGEHMAQAYEEISSELLNIATEWAGTRHSESGMYGLKSWSSRQWTIS